jgi:hypothetical protein
MKTITIKVSETDYRAFQQHAKRHDRTASELIREAMAQYRTEKITAQRSLLDAAPLSLGQMLMPLDEGDDLLEEMLDD